jgi:1-deoxy-D-xylulose-5-phosphate reductoisomerase
VAKKGISILGSTGSIGRQTLEVISSFPGKFEIIGISGKGNLKIIEGQIRKFSPRLACVEKEEDSRALMARLGRTTTTIYSGEEGLRKIARQKDNGILVVAIPGIAALTSTLSAISHGKTIALASKEILVAAGEIVIGEARKAKVKIVPLDSEHSAISQCLKGEEVKKVKKVILTASGGPFLNSPIKELHKVTPQGALDHPTWKMGRRITVGSATLMNKGFEVIEAHHLFGIDYSKIDVLIHPQSIIHSLVEFDDGSIIAQMGAPDMRIPIQYALLGSHREKNKWDGLDFEKIKPLTFQQVEGERFPCLELAYRAGRRGGTLPAVMGAADEMAVDLFLKNKIKFTEIYGLIKTVMEKHEVTNKPSVEQVFAADKWAREEVLSLV